MKKIKLLLVMLLLGSGITKGLIWEDVNGYTGFTFWNIDKGDGFPVSLIPGKSYQMYFYFSCNYDIVSLKCDLSLMYKGIPIPIIQGLDCAKLVALPIKKGGYADLKVDVFVSPQLSVYTDSLLVMKAEFYNQSNQTVAAGVTPVKITRPPKI